jgi:hypothetical protein
MLLQSLGKAKKLGGLNAVVAIVDTVGYGAKGVSVLLASKDVKVTVDALESVAKKPLRVGRWHAKDEETNFFTSFDEVLASMRGEKKEPATAEQSNKGFAFVLGELDSLNTQATKINHLLPSADIVSSFSRRFNFSLELRLLKRQCLMDSLRQWCTMG